MKVIHLLMIVASVWLLGYCGSACAEPLGKAVVDSEATLRRIRVEKDLHEIVEDIARSKDQKNLSGKMKTISELAASGKYRRSDIIDVVIDKATSDPKMDKARKRAWRISFHALQLVDDEKIEMARRLLPKASSDKQAFIYDDVLSSVPFRTSDGHELDYRYNPEFLRSQKGRLYPHFVAHLYSAYPDQAFPLLISALIEDPADKEGLLVADAVIKKAFPLRLRAARGQKQVVPREEIFKVLESLARREEWWIRFYVAKVQKKNSAYRNQEIMKMLQQDRHELVRGMTASLHVKAAL